MDYQQIKKFIEFARSRVPAKHQKPFKGLLQTWVLNSDHKDRRALAMKLDHKPEFWAPLADDMFKLFQTKEGVPSTVG